MVKQADFQRILLVEDDKLARDIHHYYLKKLGYEVCIASTGKAAIESTEANDFSAMILDLGLPDIDGAKVLSAIRNKEKKTKRHLPVIIVTAHGDPKILTHLTADQKADDGFIKPVKLTDFKKALQKLYYKKIW